jgi:hypothetical protein
MGEADYEIYRERKITNGTWISANAGPEWIFLGSIPMKQVDTDARITSIPMPGFTTFVW